MTRHFGQGRAIQENPAGRRSPTGLWNAEGLNPAPVAPGDRLVQRSHFARLEHSDVGSGGQVRGILGKGMGRKREVVRALP